MFSGCTVPPHSKETELGSSDQEASPSAGENTGKVLVSCLRMEVCPFISISGVVDICEVPGCHLLQQMSSQDWCLMNSQPTFLFLSM